MNSHASSWNLMFDKVGCRFSVLAVCRLILSVFVCLPAVASDPGPLFEDMTARSGVRFRFDSGNRGKHDLPEIMAGGLALFDANGDGRLDVYLCNGGPIQAEAKADANDPPSRLFLNLGNWRFEDVTNTAGAPGPGYAMGTAVADVDGDGNVDLFVTGWGGQRLYRNLGNARFEDVTQKAGLTDKGWSSSAVFADLDADGDPDLYVCHYVNYDAARPPYCSAPDGKRDYCGPEVFKAQGHRLYRNNGQGSFEDVSREAGLLGLEGRGLGVLAADLTDDGRLDLFVANDGSACWLLENQGCLKFKEIAADAGVAYNGRGEALAGMGVALGDVDGDSQADLLATNFHERGTVAWRCLEPGLFRDDSDSLGLRAATRQVLGFGLALADFDGDGDLDLLQANGHVLDRERLGVPLAMRPLYLTNEAQRFKDASTQAGPAFTRKMLGRGVAVGDLDNDGRPDAVIATLDGPPLLLRNRSSQSGVTIVPRTRERNGQVPIGVRVRTQFQGQTRVRVLAGGGSYLATSAPEIHLPVGPAGKVEKLEVLWPSGTTEIWENLDGGRRLMLREGTGARAAP